MKFNAAGDPPSGSFAAYMEGAKRAQTANPAEAPKPQFVAVAPTPAEAPKARLGEYGKFAIGQTKDTMTDVVSTLAINESKTEEKGMFGGPDKTALLLGCSAEGFHALYAIKTMVIPDFDIEGDKYEVSYRFDSEPATDGYAPATDTNQAFLLPANIFLARTGGTVTIRLKDGAGTTYTSTFDLTNIANVLSALPCVRKASE